MKILTFIFFVCIASWSCKDDETGKEVCNTSNPASMNWVKKEISIYKQSGLESTMYLEQGKFKPQYGEGYVYWFNTCCSTCDFMIVYYTCEGEEIQLPQTVNHESPFNDIQVVWKGENFQCKLM